MFVLRQTSNLFICYIGFYIGQFGLYASGLLRWHCGSLMSLSAGELNLDNMVKHLTWIHNMFVKSYSVTYCIYIPGKPGICFRYYCAVYDECKYLDTFCRIRLFVH